MIALKQNNYDTIFSGEEQLVGEPKVTIGDDVVAKTIKFKY